MKTFILESIQDKRASSYCYRKGRCLFHPRVAKYLKDNKRNKASFWRKNVLEYLFLQTQSFLKLRSRIAVRISEQRTSADKYRCIFSRQIEAIDGIFFLFLNGYLFGVMINVLIGN